MRPFLILLIVHNICWSSNPISGGPVVVEDRDETIGRRVTDNRRVYECLGSTLNGTGEVDLTSGQRELTVDNRLLEDFTTDGRLLADVPYRIVFQFDETLGPNVIVSVGVLVKDTMIGATDVLLSFDDDVSLNTNCSFDDEMAEMKVYTAHKRVVDRGITWSIQLPKSSSDVRKRKPCYDLFTLVRDVDNASYSLYGTKRLCVQENACVETITESYGFVNYTGATENCTNYIYFIQPATNGKDDDQRRTYLQFQELTIEATFDDQDRGEYVVDIVEDDVGDGSGGHHHHIYASELLSSSYAHSMLFSSRRNLAVRIARHDVISSLLARHYTFDVHKDCNRTIDSSNGFLTSPLYPDSSPPSIHCVNSFVLKPNQLILIEIVDLYFEINKKYSLDRRKSDDCGGGGGGTTLWFACGRSGGGGGGDINNKTCDFNRTGDNKFAYLGCVSFDITFSTNYFTEHSGFKLLYNVINFTSSNQSAPSIDRLDKLPATNDHSYTTYTISVPENYSVNFVIRRLKIGPIKKKSGLECLHTNHVLFYFDFTFRILCGDWSDSAPQSIASQSNFTLLIMNVVSDENQTGIIDANLTRIEEKSDDCDDGWKLHEGSCYHYEEKSDDCDDGWKLHEGSCYHYHRLEPKSWQNSRQWCRLHGSDLVSVENQGIQLFVEELIQNSAHAEGNHNKLTASSIWVGGSDSEHENDFVWVASGKPFGYTNWFDGWKKGNKNGRQNYGAQPSDDGLSNQDCVELRNKFEYPGKGSGKTVHYYWNDRNCEAKNPFICLKKSKTSKSAKEELIGDCNTTLILSKTNRVATISSPNYPDPYPNLRICYTNIFINQANEMHNSALHGDRHSNHRIKIIFQKLITEYSPSCQYDYLQIASGHQQDWSKIERLCGDWSEKMKLLEFRSNGTVTLRFVSDSSHVDDGYFATVALVNDLNLTEGDNYHDVGGDENEFRIKSTSCIRRISEIICYKLVSEIITTWFKAERVCQQSYRGNLASVQSEQEENIIIGLIRQQRKRITNAPAKSTLYWLGGQKINENDKWRWTNNNRVFTYSDWHPGNLRSKRNRYNAEKCLAVAHVSKKDGNGRVEYSGLYWTPHHCYKHGMFVCQIVKPVVPKIFNQTKNAKEGVLSSSSYPLNYSNNLHQVTRIIGKNKTRIIIELNYYKIEWQKNCLYDYLTIADVLNSSADQTLKFCGSNNITTKLVSISNQITVTFHTDSTIASQGFTLRWKTVDLSMCPLLVLDNLIGQDIIQSPNYPNAYLPGLECRIVLKSKDVNHRIHVKFYHFDVGNYSESCSSDRIEIITGNGSSHRICGDDSDVPKYQSFISHADTIIVVFKSLSNDYDDMKQTGFSLRYSVVYHRLLDESIVEIKPDESGFLTSLNYPETVPPMVYQETRFVAPYGYIINLKLQLPKSSKQQRPYVTDDPNVFCDGQEMIEIEDFYHVDKHSVYESNSVSRRVGKVTKICSGYDAGYSKINRRSLSSLSSSSRNFDNEITVATGKQLEFLSTLNSITVRLQTSERKNVQIAFKATYKAIEVDDFSNVTIRVGQLNGGSFVDSCSVRPCLNGGRCLESNHDGGKSSCKCNPQYTGLFCHLKWCDLDPCKPHGYCDPTVDGYVCTCKDGYKGNYCETFISACYPVNPCYNKGRCVILLRNDSESSGQTPHYKCECSILYRGPRCENQIIRIAFKPLSERMLKEPFWLGLITILVVLVIILFVWCIKRKFADKIERFIKNEIEKSKRGRHQSSPRYNYNSGLRDSSATSASGSPNIHHSRHPFLIKIRKPSLRSNTDSERSPTIGCVGTNNEENRSFSFDDLMKRMQSFTRRKSVQEPINKERDDLATAKILQQLVTPKSGLQMTRRMSLDEFIQMNEHKFNMSCNLGDTTESSMESLTSVDSRAVGETSFIQGFSPKSRRKHFSFPKYPTIRENSVPESTSNPDDDVLQANVASGSSCAATHTCPINMVQHSDEFSDQSLSGDGITTSCPVDIHTSCSITSSPICDKRNAGNSNPVNSKSTDNQMRCCDASAIAASSSVCNPSIEKMRYSAQTQHGCCDVPSLAVSSSTSCNPSIVNGAFAICYHAASPVHNIEKQTLCQESSSLAPPSCLYYPQLSPSNKPCRSSPPLIRCSHKAQLVTCAIEKDDQHQDIYSSTHDSGHVSVPSFTVPGSPPPTVITSAKIRRKNLTDFKFSTVPEQETNPGEAHPKISAPSKTIITPPKILITSNVSSLDSENGMSPPLTPRGINVGTMSDQQKSPVMSYLSPLTIISAGGSRTISESNLSSSGYSSMASPGPSRCGSRTPLSCEDYELHYHPRKHSLTSPMNKSSKFAFPPSPTVIFKPDMPEPHLMGQTMCSPVSGRRSSLSAITSGSGAIKFHGPVELMRLNMADVQEQHDEGIELSDGFKHQRLLLRKQRSADAACPYSTQMSKVPKSPVNYNQHLDQQHLHYHHPEQQQHHHHHQVDPSMVMDRQYIALPVHCVSPLSVDVGHGYNDDKSLSPLAYQNKGSSRNENSARHSSFEDKMLLRVPSGSSLVELQGFLSGESDHNGDKPSISMSSSTKSLPVGKRFRKRSEGGRHSPRQKTANRSKNNSPTSVSPTLSLRSDRCPHSRRTSPKLSMVQRHSSSTDSTSSVTDDNRHQLTQIQLFGSVDQPHNRSKPFRKTLSVSSVSPDSSSSSTTRNQCGFVRLSPNNQKSCFHEDIPTSINVDKSAQGTERHFIVTKDAAVAASSEVGAPIRSQSLPQQCSHRRFLPRYKTIYQSDSVDSSIQTESDEQDVCKSTSSSSKPVLLKDTPTTTTTEDPVDDEREEEDEPEQCVYSDDSGHTEITSLLEQPRQDSVKLEPVVQQNNNHSCASENVIVDELSNQVQSNQLGE